MITPKFTKLDDGFICLNCNKSVTPLKYTSRNHCPHCLHSLHIDINPGDREETCLGTLEPIGIYNAKKGDQIVFKCNKCNIVRKNIIAEDDNKKLIIKLYGMPYNEK